MTHPTSTRMSKVNTVVNTCCWQQLNSCNSDVTTGNKPIIVLRNGLPASGKPRLYHVIWQALTWDTYPKEENLQIYKAHTPMFNGSLLPVQTSLTGKLWPAKVQSCTAQQWKETSYWHIVTAWFSKAESHWVKKQNQSSKVIHCTNPLMWWCQTKQCRRHSEC